jgi:hypothetical protein
VVVCHPKLSGGSHAKDVEEAGVFVPDVHHMQGMAIGVWSEEDVLFQASAIEGHDEIMQRAEDVLWADFDGDVFAAGLMEKFGCVWGINEVFEDLGLIVFDFQIARHEQGMGNDFRFRAVEGGGEHTDDEFSEDGFFEAGGFIHFLEPVHGSGDGHIELFGLLGRDGKSAGAQDVNLAANPDAKISTISLKDFLAKLIELIKVCKGVEVVGQAQAGNTYFFGSLEDILGGHLRRAAGRKVRVQMTIVFRKIHLTFTFIKFFGMEYYRRGE